MLAQTESIKAESYDPIGSWSDLITWGKSIHQQGTRYGTMAGEW